MKVETKMIKKKLLGQKADLIIVDEAEEFKIHGEENAED